MRTKDIFKVISFPVIAASLCCLSPVVLVLLGLSTVAFARSLSQLLYGKYEWAFLLSGLILLSAAIIIYLRKKENICTLDDVKKQPNKVVNIVLTLVISAVIVYIIWLYVIVELIGIILKIW